MNSANISEKLMTTCPACGLLCDDIMIDAKTHQPSNTQCPKSLQFFSQGFPDNPSCSVLGKATDLATAVKAAADVLANSQQPLFSGLGTEVTGMRSVIRLAEKVGATVDHMHSKSSMRNVLALQNNGWQTTTLMEVKHRADVILAIGTDIVSSHPRFFERLVWNADQLFNKPQPDVIFLGATSINTPQNIPDATSPSGTQPTIIPADIDQLPDILNGLNALINNKKLAAQSIGGISIETLNAVIDRLKIAHYAVIVWSAGNLDYAHADLTVESITQLISNLNETTRAVGLPLNSGDGDTSVTNSSIWLSGYPMRARFSKGKVIYDAHLFSTEQQLKSCDSLLWMSSFHAIAPPETTAPTIVLGHPNTPLAKPPAVFIPIGTPGIDHDGIMFRMDSAIALPLKKHRDTSLPSLRQVIQQILSHLP